MTKAGYPMSIKHLGGCTLITRVSCSPSKIPYGGFSPVRLQTGIQRRPSPTTGLYSAKASATIPYGPKGHDVGIVIADNPVQRSLAHRRVMLSRQVIAYYDLICASRRHPAAYFLRPRDTTRSERVPNLLCAPFPSCRPQHPGRPDDCMAVSTSSVSAFAQSAWARHLLVRVPLVLTRRVTRPTGSLSLRPDGLLALHRQGTFTFELSPSESPQKVSSITT